jgi:hypothetical protein
MMIHFYIPEGICFAAFVAFSCTWLYYARSHLCFFVVFVSFLILVRVFAFLPFLVVCRICLFPDSCARVCFLAFPCCLSDLCVS